MTTVNELNARRLARLVERMSELDDLLNDIETRIPIALTPTEKMHLRQDYENAEEQRNALLAKIEKLEQTSAVAGHLVTVDRDQFAAIDAKLDDISAKLDDVTAIILDRFEASERTVIGAIVQRLTAQQLSATRAILEQLDAGRISDAETQLVLREFQEAFVLIRQSNEPGSKKVIDELEPAAKIVEDPKLGIKHKLKVSIPLIPFILAYEGELGLDVGANLQTANDRLKALWERLKNHPQ